MLSAPLFSAGVGLEESELPNRWRPILWRKVYDATLEGGEVDRNVSGTIVEYDEMAARVNNVAFDECSRYQWFK